MNDKYELKKHNSTQLGRRIMEVCHDYSIDYINEAELASVLHHYSIVNIIGKKRSIYILSLEAKR